MLLMLNEINESSLNRKSLDFLSTLCQMYLNSNNLTLEEYGLLDTYIYAKINFKSFLNIIKDDLPTMEELKKIKEAIELIK
jgi:hypothetical protein